MQEPRNWEAFYSAVDGWGVQVAESLGWEKPHVDPEHARWENVVECFSWYPVVPTTEPTCWRKFYQHGESHASGDAPVLEVLAWHKLGSDKTLVMAFITSEYHETAFAHAIAHLRLEP